MQASPLDRVFTALADTTRRGILERVGGADATISDLAERFAMTRTGVAKHVRVLENAGLVGTRKEGRVRTVTALPARLEDAAGWIGAYQAMVETKLDRLGAFLERTQRDG